MNRTRVHCLLITFLFIIIQINAQIYNFQDDPWLNISEIVIARGFRCDIHTVTTEDGYILTLHHIINPFIPLNELNNRKPVLYFSGGTTTTKCYVVHTKGKLNSRGVYTEEDGRLVTNCEPGIDSASMSPSSTTNTKSSPFVLSSCGYDVWLADVRGTSISLGHVSLSYYSFSYWHFSLQEVGWYDFPAIINYILGINKSGAINIITLSQSTPALLFYLGFKPEEPKPVNLAIMTAPAIFTEHTLAQIPAFKIAPSVIRSVSLPLLRIVERAVLMYGGPIPFGSVKTFVTLFAYTAQAAYQALSNLGIDVIGIFNYVFPSVSVINKNQTAAILTVLDNTCGYIISHFMQCFISGEFKWHNRDVAENRKLYGQDSPPDVPLERINTKIGLFYGDEDFLAHPLDIKKLKSRMKVYYDYPVPVKGWKHGDYVIHEDIDRYIIPHFLHLLKIT